MDTITIGTVSSLGGEDENFFISFFFFLMFYLFLKERVWAGKGRGQGGGQQQAQCGYSTHQPWDHDLSLSWTPNWLSHLSTLKIFISHIKRCILLGGIIERFCYMRVQMCVKGSIWNMSWQKRELSQLSIYCISNSNSSFIIWYAKMELVHLNMAPCWILSGEGDGETLQEKGGRHGLVCSFW